MIRADGWRIYNTFSYYTQISQMVQENNILGIFKYGIISNCTYVEALRFILQNEQETWFQSKETSLRLYFIYFKLKIDKIVKNFQMP